MILLKFISMIPIILAMQRGADPTPRLIRVSGFVNQQTAERTPTWQRDDKWNLIGLYVHSDQNNAVGTDQWIQRYQTHESFTTTNVTHTLSRTRTGRGWEWQLQSRVSWHVQVDGDEGDQTQTCFRGLSDTPDCTQVRWEDVDLTLEPLGNDYAQIHPNVIDEILDERHRTRMSLDSDCQRNGRNPRSWDEYMIQAVKATDAHYHAQAATRIRQDIELDQQRARRHAEWERQVIPVPVHGGRAERVQVQQPAVEHPGAQWPCGACTFLNHNELQRCEMCDRARGPQHPAY